MRNAPKAALRQGLTIARKNPAVVEMLNAGGGISRLYGYFWQRGVEVHIAPRRTFAVHGATVPLAIATACRPAIRAKVAPAELDARGVTDIELTVDLGRKRLMQVVVGAAHSTYGLSTGFDPMSGLQCPRYYAVPPGWSH